MINEKDLLALMNEVQTAYETIKKAEVTEDKKEPKKEIKPDPEKMDEEGPMAEDSDPKAPMKKEMPMKKETLMENEIEPEEVMEEIEEVEEKDRDQLCAEYLAMDDDKLISHYVAMNHALAIKMQHEAHEDEEEELAEETMQNPMMKKFGMKMKKKGMKKTGKMMMKSELSSNELGLKQKIQDLEGQIGNLSKSLEKLTKRPQEKALTGDNFLTKSEPAPITLTKSEIVAKLCEKAREPGLSMADRAKITQYTYNLAPIEEIKTFLKI